MSITPVLAAAPYVLEALNMAIVLVGSMQTGEDPMQDERFQAALNRLRSNISALDAEIARQREAAPED
jgi:hypothetical protein